MAYNYWEERFKRLKTAEMRKAERANADLARVYRETLRQLRAEVEQWYDRFAKENKISLAEARRILDNRELKEFKMTLADFIKEAKRLDLDPAHIRMLENASMRVRLTRSQEIYLKTAQYVERLAKSQGWQLNGLMREVYTDSVYKTAYETQKVTGFENFRAVRERQIEEAISKPWAPDGADFSSRIWKNKTQLINSLQTDITQSLMTGTSTAQLSEKIAARFNTSYNQAYRLVETETAYIQERAMLDTYDELGLEQYQICAVLDSKTSEICQNLDGKVFDRKDAKPGITMPPFHCHCRSTTVPYIEGLLDDGGRVARDPETGKTVEIPDMTYKEWKEKYVDKQTKAAENDKIKEKETINELSKIKSSGIKKDDYDEYLSIINNHENKDIRRLYSKYADNIASVKLAPSKGAAYRFDSNSLTFNFNNYIRYPVRNKHGTLAHEYGHFFDARAPIDGLHFKEIEAIKNATGLNAQFEAVASSSDEFLAAVRKDKAFLKSTLTSELRETLRKNHASAAVQDAIDGLFPRSRIAWGHGEPYYNRRYANLQSFDKIAKTSLRKALQGVYKGMGFDASNQTKVRTICRQYEAASEMWANIMSAEVCGGEELEYVKKFLPNAYKALLEILKGVK